MNPYASLSGETRVLPIIGDPIAQVKSPAGVTQSLLERGLNALVIPVHVTPAEVDAFIRGITVAHNFDGIIVTVPHKFAAYHHCTTATDRAHFLGAVNMMRRNPDGTWHGDMSDGIGFVAAIREAGAVVEGARALLVGAGGAGSAIAQALLENGVAQLAVHDGDRDRRDRLVERLQARYGDRASSGSDDPGGCTLIVNATPMGMRPRDPYPVQVDKLTADMFVGCVITAPPVSPVVEAARQRGCKTQVGIGMFAQVRDLMIEFLTATGNLAPRADAAAATRQS